MRIISRIRMIAFIGVLCGLLACGDASDQLSPPPNHQDHSAQEGNTDQGAMKDEEHLGEHEEEHEEVHLSRAQMEAIGLKTGTFSEIKIAGYFTTNGIIDLPPTSIATVNTPEIGFVKKVEHYVVGSYVRKGAVLATLEHPVFIQKQQEYLESISELTWLEQDLERQKTLSDANVNALKAMQKAQFKVNVMTARKNGLERYLEFIGIDVQLLKQGEITQTIFLKAPISGFLTEVNANIGMLVTPGMELYGIVNNDHIHLELNVFEKDIDKLVEGQKVSFTIPAFGEGQFNAEVHEIGRSFDAENKSLRVHCHIIGNHPKFVRGLYAEAKIWLDDRTVTALPGGAIVRNDGNEFIFLLEEDGETEEFVFKPIRVTTGKEDLGFVEIRLIDEVSRDAAIVTHGAYYLMAEMNKGEGGHHH